MTGKQEGPYKGEETKAEEDKVWQFVSLHLHVLLSAMIILLC